MNQRPVRRLAAILSADAVGYSRLMAQDEAATVEILERYRDEISGLVTKNAGRVVDAPGDNLLAEFSTATEATEAAVNIQKRLVSLNIGLSEARKMEFRIGIHLGEVRVEGNRLYGDTVNIAARIEGLAEASSVCISAATHEQVHRNSDHVFQDQGVQRVKNIPRPIRVYRVLWQYDGASGVKTASPHDVPPVVAVLPFVNMSLDADQEFFADGITEEIINALARVKEIRVIARTSAFSFKNSGADIGAIGAKLNASVVVAGSIKKAEERLRINVELVDVAGGHQLWSEHYDRTLDDIFEIQDDIAATVARTVRPKLLHGLAESFVTRPTTSQAAYELYLRASERLSRLDRWDTRTAIEMLKDATSLDENYADAWARLGSACCQMDFAFEPNEGWQQQAGVAIGKAFELDATNAEASCAQARLLWNPSAGFQHGSALRALKQAIERRPGMHFAHLFQGVILIHVGLFEEAEHALAHALATEPGNAHILNALAQAHNFRGDLDAAEEYYIRSRRADPGFAYNYVFLPALRIYQNDLSEAEAELDRSREILGDDPTLDSTEGLLWAARGEIDKADEALTRASIPRDSLGHEHHTWHHSAAAYAVLGRVQEAVESLRRASVTGFPNYPLFRDDILLAPLQKDPGMKRLLSELENDFESFRLEFGTTQLNV